MAEDELVEADGQVLLRDAAMGAVHPGLEVGDRAAEQKTSFEGKEQSTVQSIPSIVLRAMRHRRSSSAVAVPASRMIARR
jgi:hypothetical protein